MSQKSYAKVPRAGCRLDSDDLVVCFAAELLAHEGSDQAAEVGTAACAADDHVGLDAVFVKCGLGLETDDRLVQEHLVQHGAEHVAVAGVGDGDFDSFGNRAAERTGRAGEFGKNLAADLGFVGRRGRDVRAVGTHHFTAEGLLFVGNLNHENLAVETEVCAGHRESRAPLAGAGFGCDALQALLLCVVGLRDRGIQLVRAGGVVAFKFVVNLSRGLQLFFQAVSADERRRTVHFVEIADFLRDRVELRVVVQFLLYKFFAEDAAEFFGCHGLAGTGIQKRRGLIDHVGAKVIPCRGHFAFFEVDLVRDFLFVFHVFLLFLCVVKCFEPC